MEASPQLQIEVEQFLYREARLLDSWQLEQWAELFTEDALYLIPSSSNPDGEPANSLMLVADNIIWLRSRVKQLLGRSAFAEFPHSRTRHLVTNVEILDAEPTTLKVGANFIAIHVQHEIVDTFTGFYEYELVRVDGKLKIRRRRAVLDMQSLRPSGKISFIL
jgi:p-cumate 2,3-dioxygenase subunit beta